jgi:hypothetical protein
MKREKMQIGKDGILHYVYIAPYYVIFRGGSVKQILRNCTRYGVMLCLHIDPVYIFYQIAPYMVRKCFAQLK